MKFFVCHYTPLAERRALLERQLRRERVVDVEWVTEHDVAGYDEAAVYDPSAAALAARNRTAFSRFCWTEPRRLKPAEVEITLQHIEVYRRILAQGLECAAILEDDAVLPGAFVSTLDRLMRQLPTDWDVLYFGGGSGLHVPLRVSQRVQQLLGVRSVFRHPLRQSRFTHSYVARRRALAKLMPGIIPFHLPIDWELNYLQNRHALEVYWAEPPVTVQGSASGAFASNLR